MKNVLLSAVISATLGLTALPSMAKDVDLAYVLVGGQRPPSGHPQGAGGIPQTTSRH